jgi:hypothetical protein
MSHKPGTELTYFEGLAIRWIADQDFKPSRPKLFKALAAVLNELELHRTNSAYHTQGTVRVPGWLSETEEALLPYVRDPNRDCPKIGNPATGGDRLEIYDD